VHWASLETYWIGTIFFVPAGTLRLPWLRFFRAFFLSCKANAGVKPAKMGHGPHYSKIFVLFYVLFVLCRSVFCLCLNMYCTTATGWLPNCSEQIYQYQYILEDGSAMYRDGLDLMDSEDMLYNINLAFCNKEKELPKRRVHSIQCWISLYWRSVSLQGYQIYNNINGCLRTR
jgi:hypothetical protein